MFARMDPGEHTPESLQRAIGAALEAAIQNAGRDTVVAGTALSRETIDALADGPVANLTVQEGASIFALTDSRDADAIAADARDRLLLEMSNAVMDVEALAQGLGGKPRPKELQAKIEGRQPMTVAEYTEIATSVAGER